MWWCMIRLVRPAEWLYELPGQVITVRLVWGACAERPPGAACCVGPRWFFIGCLSVAPQGPETTLTKDTVPVNVDAVVFWMVWNAEKSILEVENFWDAITLSAQTALRESIGRHELAQMLTERETLGREQQRLTDAKAEIIRAAREKASKRLEAARTELAAETESARKNLHNDARTLAEATFDAGRTHAEKIMDTVDEVLARAGVLGEHLGMADERDFGGLEGFLVDGRGDDAVD